MRFLKLNIAGIILFVAALQYVLVTIISMVLHPDFNAITQLVDDLAIGPYGMVYASSIMIVGLLWLFAASLIYASLKPKLFTALMVIAGIFVIGIGVVPPTVFPHGLIALIAVVFEGLTLIFTYKIVKSKPLRYLSAILGIFAIVTLMMIVFGMTFGLTGIMGGLSGFTVSAWAMIFGLYLAFRKTDTTAKE